MNKKDVLKKPNLSWNKEDYEMIGDEVPPCVLCGITEGENMEPEDINIWSNEQIRTMLVIKEEYPERFLELYNYYVLDLEYLLSLGKISGDEKKQLENKENFNFGQEQ